MGDFQNQSSHSPKFALTSPIEGHMIKDLARAPEIVPSIFYFFQFFLFFRFFFDFFDFFCQDCIYNHSM